MKRPAQGPVAPFDYEGQMKEKRDGAEREVFSVGRGSVPIRRRSLRGVLRPGGARLQLMPDFSGGAKINQERPGTEDLAPDGPSLFESRSVKTPPGIEASVLFPELFKRGAERGPQQRRPAPGGAAAGQRRDKEEKREQGRRAAAGRDRVEFSV